jgi:hypothetical protein
MRVVEGIFCLRDPWVVIPDTTLSSLKAGRSGKNVMRITGEEQGDRDLAFKESGT